MTVLKEWNPITSQWETIVVGKQGPPGVGGEPGGNTNDLIVKQSAVDYDTAWQDEITVDKVTFDTLAAEALTTAGEVAWDFDLETLNVQLNGNVGLHLGQETFYHVKNQTGSTIPKGTVVRAAGTVGNSGRILIAPFLANGTFPSQVCMGVTTEAIDDGDDGFVTHFGLIRGINLSAFQDFDILYASSTSAGGFTATPPAAPNNNVIVALVIHAVNNGILFVRPTFGSSLANDELVNLAGLATGDGLAYDGTKFVPSKFAPRTPTVGTGLATTGTVALDMAALDGTYQSIALTGDPTFTTSNRAAGRTVTIKLSAGGSARTLAWPSWIFVGAAAPTTLASGKTAVVTVTFFDTTDAAAVAAYAAQP